jgi:hypothetical protein
MDETTVSYSPWGKKNPYLSMWLSGANAVFGASRNHMHAAATRHANAAMTEGTKQLLRFWGVSTPLKSTPKRRRRR